MLPNGLNARHKRLEAVNCQAGSSPQSLIEIPDKEETPLHLSTPKNSNKFQATMQMLASLSPSIFDSIVGFVTSKRKASDNSNLDEVSEPKKLKLLTTEGETKITPSVTVHYQGIRPKKLAEEGDMMPRRKLASKISIINISQFKKESLLTKDEFCEAIDGAMMVFTMLGNTSYIRQWDDHRSWLLNLLDFKDNSHTVLTCDIKLRHEYWTGPFKFNLIHYNTRYQSKLANLQLAQMKQLEHNMHSSLGGRSAGLGPSSSRGAGPQVIGWCTRGGGTSAGTGRQFLGGNGGAGLAPICLICSHKGHFIWDCTMTQFPDGAPVFAKTRGCTLHP
ncbi:hypothetical protein OE88DRAFT_1644318 [Heliocybe sulcata]|uniref:Uncharacterized protein n=1 Tax=Heliocybe sulcata TaxID=5364 RepID=A0A5C3N1W0_9AGAM|nr:hypothetical protein OE88DRAFT_1644318 [Heliocybe sulcata]